MPELLDERVVTLEFDDLHRRVLLSKPVVPLPRTVGVHQSGILCHIARNIGILKPGELDEEEYPLLWALGAAWEEYAASFYPDMEWQPGELTVDDISMNADGLSCGRIENVMTFGDPFLEEFKFTFKGVATGAEFLKDKKWWLWLKQAAGYCHGYGTRVVRWHVCHVRGDYKSFGPVYRQYVVRFSDREIAQNWQMLLNNRDAVQPETGSR